MTQESRLVYFFLTESHKFEIGDPLSVVLGQPLPSTLRRFWSGFYGYKSILTALYRGRGSVLCCIEISNDISESEYGEIYGTSSKVLWMEKIDEKKLHKFICLCAKRALTKEREAGREPDARLWTAVEVGEKWLEGSATDEEMRLSYEAAYKAAYAVSHTDDALYVAFAAASAASAASARYLSVGGACNFTECDVDELKWQENTLLECIGDCIPHLISDENNMINKEEA